MSCPAANHTTPLLEMRGIDKRFGAVHANRSVDLTLEHGEILGLLGENGAGKTTLMNVLFGIYAADAGSVRIGGRRCRIGTPAAALAAGIGMVHQHFHLVAPHTVIENLMLGQRGGGLHRGAAIARLAAIAGHYGLELDPDARVADLSVGEQQRLEIVKALYRGARILILDEPTSVLTPQQSESLFAALRALAADRVGIIFITHKLDEVLAITDRITVMRRGAVTAHATNDGTLDRRRIAELMCGYNPAPPPAVAAPPGATLLAARGLRVATRGGPGKPFDIELRGGEILGVAGVSGSGQRELAETLAGVRPSAGGTIEVDGQPIAHPTVRRMQALGIGHVPEDRIGEGLLGGLTLADSMMLTRIADPRFSRGGWLRRGAIRAFVEQQVERYDIRGGGAATRTALLSGGNLQKVLLARELAFDPRVLIAAQPTRGLDVGAVEFVHQRIVEVAERGGAVLLISEDLEELMALSARVMVMFEGGLAGILDARAASAASIGLLMTGTPVSS